MLKFVNKQGKKVMEMKDSGEIKFLDKNLKESFEDEIKFKEKQGEKNND